VVEIRDEIKEINSKNRVCRCAVDRQISKIIIEFKETKNKTNDEINGWPTN